MLVFVDPLAPQPPALVLIDLGIAGIVMTIGPILLAVRFKAGRNRKG